MGIQLTRVISSGAIGAGSGVLGSGALGLKPITVMGQTFGYDTVLEVAALVGGAAIQMFMPYTMPEVVDGVVDAGVALGARRLTAHVMKKTSSSAAAAYGMGALGGRGAAYPMGAGFARPAIGNISTASKRKLT